MMKSVLQTRLLQRIAARNGSTATSGITATTAKYIELEEAKSAHNYHPIPRVISRGKGVYVWDVDNKVKRDILFIFL